MNTGIKFRIIEDNKKVLDTAPIPILPDLKTKLLNEEFILEEYNGIKEKFPNAEIIVICETVHWETYEPMSKLLAEDIAGLIKKADKVLKQGLL
jgi:hypothetical protein